MVLEMETGNEPILIHEDRPDMEQVTPGEPLPCFIGTDMER